MSSYKITTTKATPDATPFLPGRNATLLIPAAATAITVTQDKADGSGSETVGTGATAGSVLVDITITGNLKTSAGSAYLLGGA